MNRRIEILQTSALDPLATLPNSGILYQMMPNIASEGARQVMRCYQETRRESITRFLSVRSSRGKKDKRRIARLRGLGTPAFKLAWFGKRVRTEGTERTERTGIAA